MADFSIGTVVQLKSGGPAMTVQETWDNEASCAWFSGQEVKYASFPIATLKKVDKE